MTRTKSTLSASPHLLDHRTADEELAGLAHLLEGRVVQQHTAAGDRGDLNRRGLVVVQVGDLQLGAGRELVAGRGRSPALAGERDGGAVADLLPGRGTTAGVARVPGVARVLTVGACEAFEVLAMTKAPPPATVAALTSRAIFFFVPRVLLRDMRAS